MYMSVRGKGARDKGSRAERKVRDILRKIYPQRLRSKVQRVPLSGAAAIKGDVMDMNDPDTTYEVKAHETLHIPDWWRQTLSQTGGTRTPVLVITQNFRPFYFLMDPYDWQTMMEHAGVDHVANTIDIKQSGRLFDKMVETSGMTYGMLTLKDYTLAVIPSDLYVSVKTMLLPDFDIE